MNLAANRITYKTDGTYQEITETGAQMSGNWKFINNETETEVVNVSGTFRSSIVVLSENSYQWNNGRGGRYGKMIPQ